MRRLWPDLTLDLFLSRFPIQVIKPVPEHKFSNVREITASKEERAIKWYGLTLPEYRLEATGTLQNYKEEWLPGDLYQEESRRGQMEINGRGSKQSLREYATPFTREGPRGPDRAQGGRVF